MIRDDGAKGVPPGATLTVRDVRAFRVKVLNTVKLSNAICGLTLKQQEEIDKIGIGEGDDDTRTLFARALELLHLIAKDPSVRGSMRYRAAKTVTESLRDLRRDGQDGKVKSIELLQRSREHADKMRMEDRKVHILESKLGLDNDPLSGIPLAELRKLRDGPETP